MTSLDNQTGYWNKVAYEKNFSHPFDMKRFSSLISKDRQILDCGCGYGRICKELWKDGYHFIHGVDTSSQMIERGKKKYPHLSLQTLSEDVLPFESDSFDAVILFAVLTCIPSDEGQKAILRDVYRVLRDGGIIYASDYWLQEDKRNCLRYNASENKYKTYGVFELSDGAILRHHDRKWIAELFSIFNTIGMIDLDVVTMNGNKAKAFQYFGQKKEEINQG